jgi:hypothetical protein
MKTGTSILMAALLFGAMKAQLRAADEVNEALQKGLVEEEANRALRRGHSCGALLEVPPARSASYCLVRTMPPIPIRPPSLDPDIS